MGDANLLTFNGVNGATGDYFYPPRTAQQICDLATGHAPEEFKAEELSPGSAAGKAHLGGGWGVDPHNLASAGWGAIFAKGADADGAIRSALKPLLEMRERQANAEPEKPLYKLYVGEDGYWPGETYDHFRSRHGAAPGAANPEKMPYYLLIVGDPETIPYSFQYEMDVQYAVGRIHFDTPQEYAYYAQSVVAAEREEFALPRRAAFFATANPGDPCTQFSHDNLAAPLVKWVQEVPKFKADAEGYGWTIESCLGDEARKAKLASLLADAPALIFTASHGLCYPNGDSRQLLNQGALVTQDWQGPQSELTGDCFFAGSDVDPQASLHGSILMHFACFGAGTPRLDDFPEVGQQPVAIAPQSFVGQLPQRLLAHPSGGALAVIGHIDRAWGTSFYWDGLGQDVNAFESTVASLMDGDCVGHALEYFSARYSDLLVLLTKAAARAESGNVDPYGLSALWGANNDTRNYALLGDPAVRLKLAARPDLVHRPALKMEAIEVNDPNSSGASSPASSPDDAPGNPPAPPAGETPPAARPTPAAPVLPAQPAAAYAAAPPSFAPAAMNYAAMPASVQSALDSLQSTARNIGATLVTAFKDVTTVEVRTYTSDDIAKVEVVDGEFTGAALRAVTIASLDGNTRVCVPREQDGKVDDALWAIHSDTFNKALANRIEMLKTAVDTITSLVPGLKGQ